MAAVMTARVAAEALTDSVGLRCTYISERHCVMPAQEPGQGLLRCYGDEQLFQGECMPPRCWRPSVRANVWTLKL